MTTTRRFTADDLFRFNNVNLDHYTETVRVPPALSHTIVQFELLFSLHGGLARIFPMHGNTTRPKNYGIQYAALSVI